MRLTDSNLNRHRTLFAETGPNRGVLIRIRPDGKRAEGEEIVAEACKLLVWGEDREGWTVSSRYCEQTLPTVADLISNCPELSKHHYIPSERVYWW